MSKREVQDGSGRTHIVVSDGGPYVVTIDRVDCSRMSVFSPIGQTLELQSGRFDDEGPFREGVLFMSADVVDDPTSGAAHDFLTLDVNVLASVGGLTTVIARYSFAPNVASAVLELPRVPDRISFEVRQLVDGVGDSSVTPRSLGFAAQGRFWR